MSQGWQIRDHGPCVLSHERNGAKPRLCTLHFFDSIPKSRCPPEQSQGYLIRHGGDLFRQVEKLKWRLSRATVREIQAYTQMRNVTGRNLSG